MNAKKLGDVLFDEFTNISKKMQKSGYSAGKAANKAYSALSDLAQSDKGIAKLTSYGFSEDLIEQAGQYIDSSKNRVLQNGKKMFGNSPKYSSILDNQQVWNTLMNNTKDVLNKWN